MSAILRPMREEDLSCVLAWRNHPDVRRYMFTQHEIPFAEHQRWFKACQSNPARTLLILEYETHPLGFVSFNQITPEHIADWGFYLAPDAPEGSGQLLGNSALGFAFKALGLHKVCGQALGFNDRSMRFHLRLGFTREAELRDQYFDGQHYHAVIHFGLLHDEWLANQRVAQT